MELVLERRQQGPNRPAEIDRKLRRVRRQLENLLRWGQAARLRRMLAEYKKREDAIEARN